jgi:transcription initiation factor IIE alpha subunit
MPNEYEAKIKSVADTIRSLRENSGATSSTFMFAIMATLVAKNKISDKDLDVIFDVEKSSTRNTLKSYYDQGQGDPRFEIKSEQELNDIERVCDFQVDEYNKFVKQVASQIKTKRQKRKDGTLPPARGGDEDEEEEEDEE